MGEGHALASSITREKSPPGLRQSAHKQRREKACKGSWLPPQRKVQLTRQQATRGAQLKVIHHGRCQKKKKKKRPRVCKLDIPSKKPHHSIPVGRMMFAKEKVQPQPCKRNKILHDLKADNILAFQMSLLIFPPFRTAKSLHGCF